MAFMAIILGLGLLFYILLGFRFSFWLLGLTAGLKSAAVLTKYLRLRLVVLAYIGHAFPGTVFPDDAFMYCM